MEVPTRTHLFWGAAAAVALVWYYNQQQMEKFGTSWENDVFLVRGYIGPQIGDVYHEMRARYAHILLAGPQPYVPKSGDIVLSDPYLVPLRQQFRELIDSWISLMKRKYGIKFVTDNLKTQGVGYTNNPDGTLAVHNTVKGETTHFLV